MTFREGLIRARSHIIFIIALICAMWLANVLEEKLEHSEDRETATVTVGDMRTLRTGRRPSW
jgi:hypothetical protein